MQKMNIYRDMYEGHDLKMVAGMNSDSLLFDPWPHAFLGTMEPDERRRFMDAYRERNNEFYSKQRTFKEVAEWKYQRYLQDYMACVASVDESVGEILDYLKRTGLDKIRLSFILQTRGSIWASTVGLINVLCMRSLSVCRW